MPSSVQKRTRSRQPVTRNKTRRTEQAAKHSVGNTLQPFAHVTEAMLHREFKHMVFSPVWGVVDYICRRNSNYEIGIYLRGYNDLTYDPHSIFAPISGTIRALSYASTAFTRVLKHKVLIDASIRSNRSPVKQTHYYKEIEYPRGTQLLKTREKKNGILTVKIGCISFNVEVGHRYITKSLALYTHSNDVVLAGQHLGDILIGSYCVLQLPRTCELFVREGDNVIGGVHSNPLARLSKGEKSAKLKLQK